MRLTVLGGCGAWPAAGTACSGYLVEHDGFRLLIDPGYAIVPRLLQFVHADDVDAVLVSHGHPDHCADLNPLLRARKLRDDRAPAPALPVCAPPSALRPVLTLGAGRLVLTHLMPDADPDDSVLAAAERYAGPIAVASPGLIVEIDR
jgi:ribonuclease BN (tRNA processing enzyme)